MNRVTPSCRGDLFQGDSRLSAGPAPKWQHARVPLLAASAHRTLQIARCGQVARQDDDVDFISDGDRKSATAFYFLESRSAQLPLYSRDNFLTESIQQKAVGTSLSCNHGDFLKGRRVPHADMASLSACNSSATGGKVHKSRRPEGLAISGPHWTWCS